MAAERSGCVAIEDRMDDQEAAPARYQPMVAVLAAVCGGVLADAAVAAPFLAWWSLSAGACLGWAWAFRRGWRRLACALALLAAAGLSAAWRCDRWRLRPAADVAFAATEVPAPACVDGVVLRGPEWAPAPPADPLRTASRSDRSRLTLRLTRLRDGRTWRPATGVVSLWVDGRVEGTAPGDRVRVWARLRRPAPPRNPGEFDFAARLRADGVLALLEADHAECLRVLRRGGWSGRRALERVRRAGRERLRRYVGPDRAPLAAALLLGAREQLAAPQVRRFLEAGAIHYLAVSGLHVGMLASLFLALGRLPWFSRQTRWRLALGFALAYAAVVGPRPPVVRAAVLVAAVGAALLAGRRPLGDNTLAAAGVVVVALAPDWIFHTGAQLSFLAVAVLVHTKRVWLVPPPADPLARLIARTRPWPVRAVRRLGRAAWSLWAASACIWLAALPLTLYRYHFAAPAALVLNPLLWPLVAGALFSALAVVVFGGWAPPVAALGGAACDGCLAGVELLVGRFAGSPGACLWTPGPAGWRVLLFYAAAAAAAWRRPRWTRAAWAAAVWVGVVAAAFPRRGPRPAGPGVDAPVLECVFLAVGHGQCVACRLPDGRVWVYDAGRLGDAEAAVRPIAGCLWRQGVRRVDTLWLSHPDADHFNAAPELLRRFAPARVCVPGGMFQRRSPAVAALRRAVWRRRVRLEFVAAEQPWRPPPGVRVETLHPPALPVSGGDNANSVVLWIAAAGRSVLLTGDLEPPGLDRLLRQRPRRVDVLLAPHHGSPRSDPAALARWARPREVVISGASGEDRPATETAYQAAGARVWHTGRCGAVRVVVRRSGALEVARWAAGAWRPAPPAGGRGGVTRVDPPTTTVPRSGATRLAAARGPGTAGFEPRGP